MVNILSTPCSHKMSNMLLLKTDKIWCVYAASHLYITDIHPVG
jgi:hypothetical protein